MKRDTYKRMQNNRNLEILKKYNRPNASCYINSIFENFVELSGDRVFANDPSIVCGVALLDGIPVTVVGQQRGLNLDEQIECNFSMIKPEGYRKSLRVMKQAEKFKRPIVCFVDTIGAYPGTQAEEHGQIYAVSQNITEMLSLRVPIITILIGNGGSGGALALCIADRIAILEYAVLTVISPKACAEILWKNTDRELDAVKILGMSSKVLLNQGIVDYIISEPYFGAQEDIEEMAKKIKMYLVQELTELCKIPTCFLLHKRQKKFRGIGE